MLRTFAIFALLLACASVNAFDNRVHIVLDASGSMWGQIEGRSKIEIAREAFAELMAEWPAKAKVGLTLYGHRREGDCGDIETLFSTDSHDPQVLADRVNKTKPKGKTPLYDAIARAAEDMNFKRKKAVVIVLSDGRETCNDDPCAALKLLKQKGIGLIVHVIGFDVSQEEAEQLHCMANATGGSYFSAQDAAQLSQALHNAVAVEMTPLKEELGEAILQIPTKVIAGKSFQVNWSGPDNGQDRLAIMAPGSGGRDFTYHYAYTQEGTPLTLKAPDKPGPYEVLYVTGKSRTILARVGFESVPPTVRITAPASVTAGSEFKVDWSGPGNPGETLRIFPKDAADDPRLGLHYTYAVKERDAVLRAPTEVGSYEIRYVTAQSRTALTAVAFEVTAADVVLAAPEAIHAGEPIAIRWQGPASSGDRVGWFGPLEGKGKMGDFAYTKSGKNPINLIGPAAPGTYEVQYVNHKDEAIAMAPLRVLEVNVSLTAPAQGSVADEISIEWFGPQAPGDMVGIWGQYEGREKRFDYQYAKPDKQPASVLVPSVPGDYEIRYYHGRSKSTFASQPLKVVEREIEWSFAKEVKAGERFDIVLGAPGLRQARILILEIKPDGRPKQFAAAYVTDKTDVTLYAPKEAGQYHLVYQTGKAVKGNLAVAILTVVD